jgi:hypothetical protein
MSLDTYGLSDEQYIEVLRDKTKLIAGAFKAFCTTCMAEGLTISSYGDKFVWDLFQEAVYAADDECRIIQKEQDPDTVKKRSYDFGLTPTRDELMEEIKSVSAKVEGVADYLGDLVGTVKGGMTEICTVLEATEGSDWVPN